MSNVTPQIALNKGYTVIGAALITPNSPPEPIPALAGTNRIIITADTSTVQVKFGDVANASAGISLNKAVTYYDGATTAIEYIGNDPLIIDTNTPENFAFYASGPGGTANVIYLALNT